jgi:Icc-related predicted phosphoesterase
MHIAFVGDVHGCALHALAALLTLQRERSIALDAIIQVGDLGAFRSFVELDDSDRWYVEDNPAQRQLFRVLDPDPALAATLDDAVAELRGAVRFVSGNHEHHPWLDGLHADGRAEVAIDPRGVFVHVADGTVLDVAGLRCAFLGKIDAPGFAFDFDRDALDALLALPTGSVDVLVTHDGPWGMCTSWRGETQGSQAITALVEHLQPRLHVGGHYHHVNGPRRYGATVSYALAALVNPRRSRWASGWWNPTELVSPGSIGLLDVGTGDFEYVTDEWLAQVRP